MNDRLKIGACTWIFGDLSLSEIARRLRVLDFDGVELVGDLDLYQPRDAYAILKDFGLEVFSLTPDNVDLAHPDSAIRQQAIDYYLRLLDFAAELGNPLVSCHGFVGRIRAVDSIDRERELFILAVRQIARSAAERGLCLVMEVLNRYEAHLLNTAVKALDFIGAVNAPNLGILLDAYHMNIEEANPIQAIYQVADRLWLYHAADSNRQGIGYGHTNFVAHMDALEAIGYQGPIILECTAPGPDPFSAIKDGNSRTWIETYLNDSRQWFLARKLQKGN